MCLRIYLTRFTAAALFFSALLPAGQSAEFLPLGFDGGGYASVSANGSAAYISHRGIGSVIWRRGIGVESEESLSARLGYEVAGILALSGDGSTILGQRFIGTRVIPGGWLDLYEPLLITGNWDAATPLIVPNGVDFIGPFSDLSHDGQIAYSRINKQLLVWNDPNAPPVVHEVGFLAEDISSDGRALVGHYRAGVNDPRQPARWTQETGMQLLPKLSPTHVSDHEMAVSADGRWTAGTLTTSGNLLDYQAVRWDGLSAPEPLETINPDWGSAATYMSGDGSRIVGVLLPTNNSADSFAALWTEETGMVPLKDLLVSDFGLGEALEGWTLTRVRDITDNGRFLAGFGVNPQGQNEAFLIDLGVAVPEPGSALLLAVALMSFFACAFNRVQRRKTNDSGRTHSGFFPRSGRS